MELRSLNQSDFAWLFIASFAIFDTLYLKSANNKYLGAVLSYHHGMIAALDSEDAEEITFEYINAQILTIYFHWR